MNKQELINVGLKLGKTPDGSYVCINSREQKPNQFVLTHDQLVVAKQIGAQFVTELDRWMIFIK